MTSSVLIVGASTPLGAAAIQAFAASGHPVRVFEERTDAMRESVLATASALVVGHWDRPADVAAAVEGAAIAILAMTSLESLPGERAIALVRPWVASCAAAGIPLWVTADIWALGRSNRLGPIPPGSRGAPAGRMGALLARVEALWLEEATAASLRGGLVRFPRLLGSDAVDPLMRPVLERALAGRAWAWPGPRALRHEFIHPDDAARAMVLAAGLVTHFSEHHVAGMAPCTGGELAHIVRSLVGQRDAGWLASTWGRWWRQPSPPWEELGYVFREEVLLDGAGFSARTGFAPRNELGPALNEVLRTLSSPSSS